jgi:hypothetical protein
MLERPAPLVLIVGEIEEHAKALAATLDMAPSSVRGDRRWTIIGIDKEGWQAACSSIDAVFQQEPPSRLTYIILAELRPNQWLSGEVHHLMRTRPHASLIGWAEKAECEPLTCHGLTCHTQPELQGVQREGVRIWAFMKTEWDLRVCLETQFYPLRVAMVTGMAKFRYPTLVGPSWVECIREAIVKSYNVVDLESTPGHVRQCLAVNKLDDEPSRSAPEARASTTIVPVYIVCAVVWLRKRNIDDYQKAFTWLSLMRESSSFRFLVAVLDDATLPGFESTTATRLREQRIHLCYGTADVIQRTGPAMVRRLLTVHALGLGSQYRRSR